ncbi:kelch repeat-containing protein [Gemmatimonas sp.]|uniref:Kelch repeat-containing protein n=1 Tax=Gemmatimonas sp. TaxID=1962908 RepID=UPI00286E7BE6|nr:kelch repeat-containing protein [Gemmatimonas sp.]
MSHETRRRYAVTMAAFALTSSHALPPGHPSVGRAVATAAGSVVTTSAMRVERAAHTATALRDGRVLVAGGFTNEENAVSGAELFDPAGWRFAALPRMRTLRHSHTATLLPDGKVLLVGGYTAGSTVLAAAELFDPATNRFVPTGSLGAARAGHVAVALPNGKVLIAGGVGPAWSFLSSAEIYDPATGRFTPTGSMIIARESHAAVLLQSGHVLVVGGHQGRRADITLFTSAERYDVTSGTFRKVGDMRVRRHKHDAVLLRDGRVLITGGTDERDSDGIYNSTELFDPTSATFTMGPDLVRPRYKHNGSAVLLVNGTVLIAGGAAQAETFDPRSSAFSLVSGNSQMAGQFSAVAPIKNGGVLITGGYGGGRGPRASAWVYRP